MTELHLHLDGSMRPQTIFELASHQDIALPAADAKALRAYLEVPADCPSLTDYLKRFDLPLAVLQTPDALVGGPLAARRRPGGNPFCAAVFNKRWHDAGRRRVRGCRRGAPRDGNVSRFSLRVDLVLYARKRQYGRQ